ncbi:MAG: hypothetical protein IKP14_02315 [Clostridiales bacterium]|nr:hypothetical protein [Clostridiales bacterium]
MNKTVKIILTVVTAGVVIFGGLMVYGAWDYVHRCVHIDVKEEVSFIDEGQSYAIEDLFIVYRADETCEYSLDVTWMDGSTEGIEVAQDNRSFTVVDGTGALCIYVSACNSDSPEGTGENRIVEVVSEE